MLKLLLISSTFIISFLSLYSIKYHKISRGLEDFQHIRVENYRGGSAWDEFFFEGPNASHRARLNLNIWGGFHEIKLNRVFKEQELILSYDVGLSPSSFIDLYLDRSNEEQAKGIRLSVNPVFPSLIFTRTGGGRFIKKIDLNIKLKPGLQKVKITFSNGKAQVFINDVAIERQLLESQNFRGGLVFAWGGSGEQQPVFIDNILITDSSGNEIYSNDFSLSWVSLKFIDILVPGVITFFLFLLTGRVKDQKLNVTIALTLNGIIVLFALLNYYELTARFLVEPDDVVTHQQVKDRLKTLFDRHQNAIVSSEKTIFVYGGSNAVGVGAREKEETWVELFRDEVEKQGYQLFNFGTIAATSNEILDFHKKYQIHRYGADFIVMLIGANDFNANIFRTNVKKIVEENRTSHFIILEELRYSHDLSFNSLSSKNFSSLRNICDLDEVSCFENPLKEYNHTGIIWTDLVHLTSYAQKVFATKLIFEFKKL